MAHERADDGGEAHATTSYWRTTIHPAVTNARQPALHPQHTSETAPGRAHIFARPRALQYFSDGILHKVSKADQEDVPRQAGRFELFFDLLYVVLVANLAEEFVHHPTGHGAAKYVVTFVMIWTVWNDVTHFMNLYYNDDIVQRLLVFWVMVLMMVFGNFANSVDVDLVSLQCALGTYMLSRFTLIIVSLLYSTQIHHHRTHLITTSAARLVSILICIPVYFSQYSLALKAVLIAIALVLEQLAWCVIHSPLFNSLFSPPLRSSSAIDIEHTIDRMAAFFILVLGEFLYGLVYQSPLYTAGAATLQSEALSRAVWSLLLAWSFCWLYTSSDCAGNNPEGGTHAVRWRVWGGHLWFLMHLPLVGALLVGGDVLTVFVTEAAAAAGGSGVEVGGVEGGEGGGEAAHRRLMMRMMMKRASDSSSAGLVESGGDEHGLDMHAIRWIYCSTLSIGLLSLYIISLLHHESTEDIHHHDNSSPPIRLVFPKHIRRLPRLIAAIVIVFLPLVKEDKFGNGGMLATTASLVAGVVLWEMVGALRRGWLVVEGKEECKAEAIEETRGGDEGEKHAVGGGKPPVGEESVAEIVDVERRKELS